MSWLLDKLRKRLPQPEKNPWEKYNPDAPLPQPVSQEEIDKAVEQMRAPKQNPPILSYLALVTVVLWCIGHFALLYIMIGHPISGGILAIVLVNLVFLGHYSVLLIVSIGRWRYGRK